MSKDEFWRAVRPGAVRRASRRRVRPAGEARGREATERDAEDEPRLELHARGKVRDVYEAGDDLLMVATDRISAFDVVLPDRDPGQGPGADGAVAVLVRAHRRTSSPNHLLTADVGGVPRRRSRGDRGAGGPRDAGPQGGGGADRVRRPRLPHAARAGRSTASRRASAAIDAARRAWSSPSGCPSRSSRPPTKADTGHDLQHHVRGDGRAGRPRARRAAEGADALGCTSSARRTPRSAGSSWPTPSSSSGSPDGELILIDEVLTPDSSRFWPADGYEPGRGQPSFDKQFVRDWLDASGWDHEPPPPELPADVVEQTAAPLPRGVRAHHRRGVRRLPRRGWGRRGA